MKNTIEIIGFTLLFGVCVGLRASDKPVTERLNPLSQSGRSVVPAPPVYSGDGSVVVFSSQKHRQYRGPILVFVNRTREFFQNGFNLKLGSSKCPLEVRVGDKRDGDDSVLTARWRDGGGNLRERIELPDPEAADLTRFRRAIAVAFLRAWMVEDGGTDESMRDLPAWFIDGALRYTRGVYRQTDLDRVYQLWSNGCLPTADRLYAFDSYAAKREPAVAAVLSGWFLEKGGAAFKTLLKNIAHDVEWSPEKVAEILAEDFRGDFDRMLDTRLYALGKRVIRVGVTTAEIVSRFRSELLLFPSDYGMMFSHTNSFFSFREAIDLADREEIRLSALDKAMTIRAAAAGRDGALVALSQSYEVFLRALAAGKNSSEVLSLLTRAEAMRLDLEKSVAGGQTLGSAPGVR